MSRTFQKNLQTCVTSLKKNHKKDHEKSETSKKLVKNVKT